MAATYQLPFCESHSKVLKWRNNKTHRTIIDINECWNLTGIECCRWPWVVETSRWIWTTMAVFRLNTNEIEFWSSHFRSMIFHFVDHWFAVKYFVWTGTLKWTNNKKYLRYPRIPQITRIPLLIILFIIKHELLPWDAQVLLFRSSVSYAFYKFSTNNNEIVNHHKSYLLAFNLLCLRKQN